MQCPSCHAKDLKEDFRFCPFCGVELGKPVSCPNCGRDTEPGTKFCPECGARLGKTPGKRQQVKTAVIEVGPVPERGITIEFLHSTSASFDFALQAAQAFPSFKQYGDNRKATYRVTFPPDEIANALELVEHMKGWRRRAVYVDGEKVPWNSVFDFAWCFERKQSSFRPELYCFGYEDSYQINIWGCIQANMPFVEHANWFTWGQWLNKKGDWTFDKDRIRHELQKNLHKERVTMIGVAPKGTGALQEIMRQVKGPKLPIPT
jgi:hypothetical protein